MDNVIISPYCADRSDYPYQEERCLDFMVENAGRYARVDKSATWYSLSYAGILSC